MLTTTPAKCTYLHAILGYREMCVSTGKQVAWNMMPSLAACQRATRPPTHQYACQAADAISSIHASTPAPLMSWRQIYFEQSYALSFNGINDYALLPNGALRRHSLPPGLDTGYTIDIMFLAHPVRKNTSAAAVDKMTPGGGMLLGLQDREFGRSRRAARLLSFPMLYIGTNGHLYSAVGVRSSRAVADGQWHRVTLTVVNKVVQEGVAFACLYVDGVADGFNNDVHPEHASLNHLPSYAVLGSGTTEGHASAGSVPVYNCHTLHGLIDELRVWCRALEAYEVSCLLSISPSMFHEGSTAAN